jgi:hypothetical protein
LGNSLAILGAYLTVMAMSGNGVRTFGIQTITMRQWMGHLE